MEFKDAVSVAILHNVVLCEIIVSVLRIWNSLHSASDFVIFAAAVHM